MDKQAQAQAQAQERRERVLEACGLLADVSGLVTGDASPGTNSRGRGGGQQPLPVLEVCCIAQL